MKSPLISIIISAYNAEKKIDGCLSALLNQTYAPTEIIVVDDGSTDKTKEIVKKFIDNKKIFLLEQKRQGPGAAKNLASKKAKGKILVFVDSDEYPRKDYIEKLTKPIRDGKYKTSIGAWVLAYPKNPWARCRFEDTSKLRHHAMKSGVFRAIKKDFFNQLGGFNASKGYSDDRIPNNEKRARVNDAIFDHDTDSNLNELYKKRKWIGSSIMANPKPAKFWIKVILGFMLFGFFIASFWISLWLTFILLTAGILPILYQSLRKVIFYKDVRLFFYYPIYIIITFIGMILGFLRPEYKNKT
ncbi:MAG: glycosyltransferase family 2 protein [Nanoarchaeota archaeon]|nr:glycosyltransferase family 2 protein [Nanoarchaeota archaeon]